VRWRCWILDELHHRDLLKVKATPEGTLNYAFDAPGNVLTILPSNTNGASATYTSDKPNRLSTVIDNRVAARVGPIWSPQIPLPWCSSSGTVLIH
jgi:hypothetical protein